MIKLKPHLLFIWSMYFFSINSLKAQQTDFAFSTLGVNDGLSQGTVFSILQDSQGFMWFGTRAGGLNKYDGHTFVHYKRDPTDPKSIGGNEIISLFEDSKGMIWVGTRMFGLSRFDPKKNSFDSYYHDDEDENSISHNTISGFCEDEYGKIWVATNSGVCQYDSANNNFIRIRNSIEDQWFKQVLCIAKGGKNQILVGTKSHGVYIINSKSNETTHNFKRNKKDTTSLNSNHIYTLLYDSQERLWVGTRSNGLNMTSNIDSYKFRHYTHDKNNPPSMHSNIIRTLHEDKNGSIWVGTKDGVEILTTQEQGSPLPEFIHIRNDPNDANTLNQNSVYSFAQDEDLNYWVGTWSGGINYINSSGYKFKLYRRHPGIENGLSNNVVSSFAQTKEGVWIGTEGGGLNLLDKERHSFEHFRKNENDPDALQSDHIKSLYVDIEGDLWVGTFDGLHLYHSDTHTFTRFLKGSSIYSIIKGVDDELWVGTNKNMFKVNKKTFDITTYKSGSDPNEISNNKVNIVYHDRKNRLWIGTKSGLNLYDRPTDTFIHFLNDRHDTTSITHNIVTSIYENVDGSIYIGTIDGLNKFEEKDSTFTHFTQKNGLPDNVIYNILGDMTGRLWFTTNKGVSRFDPSFTSILKKTNNFSNEKTGIENYTVKDGLQGNEFNMNASYMDKDGNLYLGGVNGFNLFNPQELSLNTNIPEVAFTDFKLFNRSVPIGEEGSPLPEHISYTPDLVLDHTQSVFSFQFVALNYNFSENNQYAYMMEGFDNDWIFIGNKKEASYTNLPAGEYIFKVRASNNDGLWNQEGASIRVTILAPWWATTWFYIGAFLFVTLLVFGGTRWRLKRLRDNRNFLKSQLAKGKKEIEEQRETVKQKEEDIRRRDEAERDMKWSNRGFIMLSNIISQNRNDLKVLADKFISSLVKYLDGQMGAIYFISDENDKKWLKLWGTYAADLKRNKMELIEIGQSLLGESYTQKEVIKVDNLPNDYALFESGFGESALKHLVIVPIIFEEVVEGVVEIMSFEEMPEHKIQLIQNIGTNLGAFVVVKKANLKIEQILAETAEQKEELTAQEEELRQNLEEIAATQEETVRREKRLLAEIENLKGNT